MTQRTSKAELQRTVQGAKLHTRVELMLLDLLDSVQSSLWGAAQIIPLWLTGAVQALAGAGAINVTSSYTDFTSTGTGNALTLADGTIVGQMKLIRYVGEGAGTDTGIITPANFLNGTSVTLTAVGDDVGLMWNGANWQLTGLRNTAAVNA